MTIALFVAIVLLTAFLQTISGFGFALLAMPLATLAFSLNSAGLMGVRTAAPLVALTGFTLYTINLLRYRQAFQWRAALSLSLAAACGVPPGIWWVAALDEGLVKAVLGAVLILFVLEEMLRQRQPASPPDPNPASAINLGGAGIYLAGFLAGLLGGAYNTPGPPVIVYGTRQGWPRNQFRSILQALFLFSSALVIAAHLAAGHITPTVWAHYLAGLPALLIGVGLGAHADRRLDPGRFRLLVNAMILLTGLMLVVQEITV